MWPVASPGAESLDVMLPILRLGHFDKGDIHHVNTQLERMNWY